MLKDRTRSNQPAPVFAALGCVTRLELLSRLSDGRESSIAELTDGLDLTRQAVTKHLKVLQHAGVVKSRRVGKESRFTIRPGSINQATSYLKRVSDQWDMSISRLRAAVEDTNASRRSKRLRKPK